MSQSNEANDYKILSVETTAKFPENNIIKFDENTKKYDSEGNLAAVYFDGDFGGFALHLVQNK